MPTSKKKKNPVIYSEKYVKGTFYNNKAEIIRNIESCENIFAIEAGKYEDGREYHIIKIDGIK